ncbi:hypothetical protein GJ654_18925 [Rhodoblastus acidophilus]|uniref:Uncharacterized protein n=1 Tax=Rhodoblastus acidophilus TaxID=1074 RepID=A0A6N8DRY1_RHOAC|nr:hypothetical protein [Rhodoblastus acidophilus]MCW2276402.1 hypothetical protein [Rhodoblastus acidophilus]MTV33058.1 hypothetical protein [Rhodoblastus acidophilus]
MTFAYVLAGLLAVVVIAGFAIKLGQASARQSGRDEVKAEDAKAEAAAARKIEAIAVQGQSDEQTISDLRDGSF